MSSSTCVLSHVWLFPTPWTREPARLLCQWNFPDKNTGVGCHSFLQGIFLKWKWNCSVISDSATPWTIAYQSGNPHGILQAKILEWVVISFSRGSSRPRDQTRVSCVSCTGRQDSFTTEPPGKPVCHNIHKYILHLCKYMPDSLAVPISLIKLYNHLGTSVPFWSLLYVGLAINLFFKMWVTDDRKDG